MRLKDFEKREKGSGYVIKASRKTKETEYITYYSKKVFKHMEDAFHFLYMGSETFRVGARRTLHGKPTFTVEYEVVENGRVLLRDDMSKYAARFEQAYRNLVMRERMRGSGFLKNTQRVKQAYPEDNLLVFIPYYDEYIIINEDAEVVSELFGLDVTTRKWQVDVDKRCRFKKREMDKYIPVMIDKGYRIGLLER